MLIANIYNKKTNEKIVGNIEYLAPSGAKGVINTTAATDHKIELPEPGLYKLYIQRFCSAVSF